MDEKKIIEIQQGLETAQKQLADKEAELTTLKKNISEREAKEKEDMLSSALSAKQITPDEKAVFAKLDRSDIATILASRKVETPSISEAIAQAQGTLAGDMNDRSQWSWDDWQTKDPKGLEKLAKENEPKFNEMFHRKYGNA